MSDFKKIEDLQEKLNQMKEKNENLNREIEEKIKLEKERLEKEQAEKEQERLALEKQLQELSSQLEKEYADLPPYVFGEQAFRDGKNFCENPYDIRNEPEKREFWLAGWLSAQNNAIQIPEPIFSESLEAVLQEPPKPSFTEEDIEKAVLKITEKFYKEEHRHWLTLYSKLRRKFYAFVVFILVFNFFTLWAFIQAGNENTDVENVSYQEQVDDIKNKENTLNKE